MSHIRASLSEDIYIYHIFIYKEFYKVHLKEVLIYYETAYIK